METPAHPGENVCPGGQPSRQAINRGFLPAIRNSADAPLLVNPVQAAILPAGVLRPNLTIGLQAPEMPVNIIRWSYISSHSFIVLRNKLKQ